MATDPAQTTAPAALKATKVRHRIPLAPAMTAATTRTPGTHRATKTVLAP